MKICSLALLLLLFILPGAVAQEAPEITLDAAFSLESGYLTDEDYTTCISLDNEEGIEVSLPEEKPCYGVYLSFHGAPVSLALQEGDQAVAWEKGYYNAYIPLPGFTEFSLKSLREEAFSISEIHLFGQGDVPGWVQQWQDFSGKADLLVFSAHPDDEFLFLGGSIPYYAGEMKKKVLVAYLTYPKDQERNNELLDGLWLCGVREYPHLSPFRDVITDDKAAFVRALGGEDKVMGYAVELLRTYRPDVVVTHDRNGEYGHTAHVAASRLMREGLALAADAGYQAGLGEPWQVKKLYLHLLKTNSRIMPWAEPLEAFDGKSALDMAREGFQKHVSQQGVGNYAVRDKGDYDCRKFGLWFSAVGEDVKKNDFFENIP